MENNGAFEKFLAQKQAELEGLSHEDLSFDTASIMGMKSITSRQPANTHAMLNFMEREIPLSSKAEIIYEAIKQAFGTVSKGWSDYSRAQFNLENNYIANVLTNSPQFYDDQESFLKAIKSDYPNLTDEQLDSLYSFYLSLGGEK